jgi:hypothetical protein
VSISDHEKALLLAVVTGGHGYTDAPSVLRVGGVQMARDILARTAPEKLAAIDRKFGGAND